MNSQFPHPFSYYASLPQGLPVIIPNPFFNQESFFTVVVRAKTTTELYEAIEARGYQMGKEEQGFYDEHHEKLAEEEDLALWAIEELAKITKRVEAINFESGGSMSRAQLDSMIGRYLEDSVDLERSLRLYSKSMAKLGEIKWRKRERQELYQERLLESIEQVGQAVKDADHLGKAIDFAKRHPILTGIFGPAIVKKILGQ